MCNGKILYAIGVIIEELFKKKLKPAHSAGFIFLRAVRDNFRTFLCKI
jgi:hypothetical protein